MVDSERTKDSLNAYIEYQLSGEEPIIRRVEDAPMNPIDNKEL